MSRPIQPSGMVGAELAHVAAGGRVADLPAGAQGGDVGGQPDGRAAVEERLAGGDHVVLAERRADVVALGALRKVKHMPPPMSTSSATPRSASITLSLSLTFEPPSTATNGRVGCSRRPRSTSTSAARSRPAALGRCCGRPDDRARGRGATPRRRRSRRRRSRRPARPTKAGSLPSSPGSNRRFSSSSTPGASSARRARIGATE